MRFFERLSCRERESEKKRVEAISDGRRRTAAFCARRSVFSDRRAFGVVYQIFNQGNDKENERIMEGRKINGLTEGSLRALGGIADADTVLGTPVFTSSGAQIVPFSKVTFGNLSGGGRIRRRESD